MQAPVDNTVNDVHYEIKFENCARDKNNFLFKQNIAFFLNKNIFCSWRHIFSKIPKNLISSAFFFFFFLPKQILKNR